MLKPERKAVVVGGLSGAKVAELVDALVLGASGATRGSSSLPFRTNLPRSNWVGRLALT